MLSSNSIEDIEIDLDKTGKMLYRRVALFGKKIEKKYGMHPCSIGGGADEGKIHLMSQSFQRYGFPLMIKEARKLIIDCLHDYTFYANSDDELIPFLEVYPFTYKNLDLVIYNFDKEGNEYYDPYIVSVSVNRGRFMYLTKEEGQEFGFKSEKYETYEEAIEILGKE